MNLGRVKRKKETREATGRVLGSGSSPCLPAGPNLLDTKIGGHMLCDIYLKSNTCGVVFFPQNSCLQQERGRIGPDETLNGKSSESLVGIPMATLLRV